MNVFRRLLRSNRVRTIAPLGILGLILAACSPGSANTTAPIFGNPLLGATAPPSDYIQLTNVTLNGGGVMTGYVSAGVGGDHFLALSMGAGAGYFDLSGNDCFAAPCPEGGEGMFAGNGSLYPPGSTQPILVSYSIDSYDYDNPDGTQFAPDTITLNICSSPFAGAYCGTFITPDVVSETFACLDNGTHSCYEVTLRPGTFGGATRAKLVGVRHP